VFSKLSFFVRSPSLSSPAYQKILWLGFWGSVLLNVFALSVVGFLKVYAYCSVALAENARLKSPCAGSLIENSKLESECCSSSRHTAYLELPSHNFILKNNQFEMIFDMSDLHKSYAPRILKKYLEHALKEGQASVLVGAKSGERLDYELRSLIYENRFYLRRNGHLEPEFIVRDCSAALGRTEKRYYSPQGELFHTAGKLYD
jgi:hypothetical protein